MIERAIRSYEGMLRTVKDGLEERWSAIIPDGHAIYGWMSEYCGFLLNRYEVASDGKTSYERMKGKKAKHQGVEFGEGILFKKKRVNQAKNLSVWEDGIYLGIRGMSGEIIVGTKAGVWKTRTVQRKPKEYRWCPTNEKLVGGVPWKTEAEDEEQEEKGPDKAMRPEMKKMEEKEKEETKARVEAPRSFTITR